MCSQDIGWALDTLHEELSTLEERIVVYQDCAEIPTSLLREWEDELAKQEERYYELIFNQRMGIEVDVFPEFRILCEQVQRLSEQKAQIFSSILIASGSMHLIAEVLQGIARIAATIELRILSYVGTYAVKGFLEQNGVKILQLGHNFVEKEYFHTRERLLDVLTQTADPRFINAGIEIFGFENFQNMRHTSIIIDQ